MQGMKYEGSKINEDIESKNQKDEEGGTDTGREVETKLGGDVLLTEEEVNRGREEGVSKESVFIL